MDDESIPEIPNGLPDSPPDGPDGFTIDSLAAAIAVNRGDGQPVLDQLARRLEAFLGPYLTIKRGILGLGGIQSLRLSLADYDYEIVKTRNQFTTRRIKMVGGVAIKTTELPIDEWSQMMAASLASMADRSTRMRATLDRLTDG
jgi:hypothetical protein